MPTSAAGLESRRDAAQQSPPPLLALAGLVPGPPRALGRAAHGAAQPAAEGGEGGVSGCPSRGLGGAGTPCPTSHLPWGRAFPAGRGTVQWEQESSGGSERRDTNTIVLCHQRRDASTPVSAAVVDVLAGVRASVKWVLRGDGAR